MDENQTNKESKKDSNNVVLTSKQFQDLLKAITRVSSEKAKSQQGGQTDSQRPKSNKNIKPKDKNARNGSVSIRPLAGNYEHITERYHRKKVVPEENRKKRTSASGGKKKRTK